MSACLPHFLGGKHLAATGCLLGFSALTGHTAWSQTGANNSLVLNSTSQTTIVLPAMPTAAETTAANELHDYLTRVTGGKFTIVPEPASDAKAPAIYVGNTRRANRAGIEPEKLKPEEWVLKSQGNALIVNGGGPRGALYAAYHLLEDQAGVHWWNPWEETVPKRNSLSLSRLDRRGKPVFGYRDIYMLYGNDGGHFMAHSRLNRQGDTPVEAKYGGSRDYGPPYHVHTLFSFLPPEKYYAAHPDWYIVAKDTVPAAYNAQLAFSNPEMRQEFLKVLRETIRKSHAEARAKGLPEPDVFSVSQQDTRVGFVSCPADEELVKKEGSEAAILLNFINFLADGIKDEFPNVYIDTLAYFSGEQAPKTIRPRDNVVVRLTDTTNNVLLPITAERNHAHRDHVVSWGKITKNLRIWDYAITFNYIGLPTPTIQTYPTDFRFWRANNVEGIFTELEYPITADMRDLKVWLYAKMLEDPNQDFDALVKEFTDGFYGPAGPAIREYLAALEKAALTPVKGTDAADHVAEITWFASPGRHTYLTADFIQRANVILDRATAAVASDPVLSRRVRHARMPLDRAATLLFGKLVRQWQTTGARPESFPLDRNAIAARYLQSWNEQIDLRLPSAEQAKEREAASAEVKGLTSTPVYMPPPAQFRDVPPTNIATLGTGHMRRSMDWARVVDDPALESGATARYEIPDEELEKYRLPMPWGVYDTVGKKEILMAQLKPEDVQGTGYHWIKVGTVKLTGNDYFYFFWSWIIQIDIDDVFLDTAGTTVDIWANIKFEGPAFPHGKPDEKNAISVERIVVIKK